LKGKPACVIEWSAMQQSVIDKAIDEWRKCLHSLHLS